MIDAWVTWPENGMVPPTGSRSEYAISCPTWPMVQARVLSVGSATERSTKGLAEDGEKLNAPRERQNPVSAPQTRRASQIAYWISPTVQYTALRSSRIVETWVVRKLREVWEYVA